MSPSLIILPEAADELDAASDWYEERAPGVGLALRAAVKGTLDQIAENPRRFPKAIDGFRRAVMKRFPLRYCQVLWMDGSPSGGQLHV